MSGSGQIFSFGFGWLGIPRKMQNVGQMTIWLEFSCSTRGALKDFCACHIFLVIHLSFLVQLWYLSVQIILLLNKTGLAIWNFRYFETETVTLKAWCHFPFHSQAQASKYHAWNNVFNLYHSFSDISFIEKKIFIYLLLFFLNRLLLFEYFDILTLQQ